MRYPASEKLEIIRIVEQSHLPAKQTLDRLGIARPTFYRWYDLYLRFGEDAWQTGGLDPSGAGTASLTRCAAISLIWRLNAPTYRPESLR
jgi:transposase-like protein